MQLVSLMKRRPWMERLAPEEVGPSGPLLPKKQRAIIN